jgi:hypothetical protein
MMGLHADQYFALEDVVGNVDAHEQRCVNCDRGLAGPDLYTQQVKINVKEAFTGI